MWSIRSIDVYSDYENLGLFDMWGIRGDEMKLSVFNVEILNEKMGLVICYCKGHRKLSK